MTENEPRAAQHRYRDFLKYRCQNECQHHSTDDGSRNAIQWVHFVSPQEIRVKANAHPGNQRILPGFEGKATDIKRGTAPSRRSNSALLEALPNAVSAARLVDLIEPPMVRVEFLDTGRNDR